MYEKGEERVMLFFEKEKTKQKEYKVGKTIYARLSLWFEPI